MEGKKAGQNNTWGHLTPLRSPNPTPPSSRRVWALCSHRPQRGEGREGREDLRTWLFSSIEQFAIAVLAFDITLEYWKLFDKAIFYVFLSVSLAMY